MSQWFCPSVRLSVSESVSQSLQHLNAYYSLHLISFLIATNRLILELYFFQILQAYDGNEQFEEVQVLRFR